MYQRPTTMAAAFINATAKQINAGKVDHVRGTGNWVARRIAISAESRPTLGIVTDFDRSPQRRTKVLPAHVIKAINEGIEEVATVAMAAKAAHLDEAEVFSID